MEIVDEGVSVVDDVPDLDGVTVGVGDPDADFVEEGVIVLEDVTDVVSDIDGDDVAVEDRLEETVEDGVDDEVFELNELNVASIDIIDEAVGLSLACVDKDADGERVGLELADVVIDEVPDKEPLDVVVPDPDAVGDGEESSATAKRPEG